MEVLRSLSVPLRRVTVQEHSQLKDVLGVVGGFLTPPVGRAKDPRQIAVQFTRASRGLVAEPYVVQSSRSLRSARPAVVQPRAVRRSPAGYHVQLQQSYEGVPIYGGRAIVHMTKERSVYFYTSDLHPELPEVGMGKAGELSSGEALEALSTALPWKERGQREPRCQQVYFPQDGGLLPAWCIDVSLSANIPITNEMDRAADWRAIVDAQSGDLFQLLNASFYAARWGRVFYPNPVVAMEQEDLSWDAQIPDSAYRKIQLAGLDDSGYLSGTYADTVATPNRVHQPDGELLYQRGEQAFLEVMAYGFVSRVMNWLARTGWPSLFAKPIRVNANATERDVSMFLPTSWELRFGGGKVMDAEDASIIVHELGHAIQEAQVEGWGTCEKHKPVRAMGEGFADWLATLYFAEQRRDFHPTNVGDWDARGYTPAELYLRRVDTPKTMDDWKDDEHADGEIWSAALWDLYMRLGGDSDNAKTRREARETALALVLTSHMYLADGRRETLTYVHGLAAILDADRFTSDDVTQPGAHDGLIREVFGVRGMTA